MSNARIQFSLASEDVWNAYNPQLKEGEIVTSVKANKKVKLVQGKVGGSTYSESTVIWDEDEAQIIMSRSEAAASTSTTQAAAASGSASKAAASQADAATSATNAKASATAAKTSETNAKNSEIAAKTSETNAKTSADSAGASKEAAQSAATTASNFASAARNSAGEAKTYKDNAKTYMDNAELYMNNAKNYSENVNVFLPSVSDSGVLSWTNKAGLPNPASVNIKGAKGDKGDTGNAATIEVGTVTTGAAGSSASVVNRGDANNAILDFILPKGADGKGSVITVNGKAPDAGGNVNVEEYTHPNSGVTAGTYRSVTVNAQGHVTGGSNPTLAIANGGTGATTAKQARANLGIKDIAIEGTDYIVETYKNGNAWYRKWKSGWVEQGDSVKKSTNQVTFPIPFANNDYSLGVSKYINTENNWPTIIDRSATGFKCNTTWGAGNSNWRITAEVSYIACGMGA